jgi:hypothetical protein
LVGKVKVGEKTILSKRLHAIQTISIGFEITVGWHCGEGCQGVVKGGESWRDVARGDKQGIAAAARPAPKGRSTALIRFGEIWKELKNMKKMSPI